MPKLSNMILPIIAAGMLIFTITTVTKSKTTPKRAPEFQPPSSNFQNQIAGIGIIRPSTNIIRLAPHIPGILSEIYVKENQKIFYGTPLFSIDESQIRAKTKHTEAILKTKQVQLEDLKQHFQRFQNVKDKRAISHDELTRKRFAVAKAEAEVNEVIENLNLLTVELSKMTIRSTINGHVLKINSRVGEYISNDTIPMIIGDLDKMQITVIIDESEMHKVDKKAHAIAIIRGQENKKFKLKFISVEPYAVPKTHLNNKQNEKIDTRVIELLYEFEKADIKAVPGQQADVFIETEKE